MNGRTTLWTLAAVMGLFALTLAGCPLIDADEFSFDLDDIDTSEFFDTDELFGPKEAVIDSADGGCFSFHRDETLCAEDGGIPDIMVEPWCTELPGICGNWVATELTSLDEMTEPPAEGYISDVAGFEDCQEVPLDQVIVFKFEDGTYAKAIIVDDVYSEDSMGCNHRLSVEYVWPMVF